MPPARFPGPHARAQALAMEHAGHIGLNDTEKASAQVPTTVAEQLRRESDSFDEKKGFAEVVEAPSVYSKYDGDGNGDDDDGGRVLDFGTDDPFPVDPNALPEQQFTFRAVFVGCALGAVISASKCVSFYLLFCVALRLTDCVQRIPRIKDGLDVRRVYVWVYLRVRNPQAVVESTSREVWGWLLRAKGECVLSECGDGTYFNSLTFFQLLILDHTGRGIVRPAVHVWLSRRLSARSSRRKPLC